MIPKQLYILEKDKRLYGLKNHNNKSYVIGFQNIEMCKYIQKNVNYRNNCKFIAQDDTVSMCKIHIPINSRPRIKQNCQTSCINADEFMDYPLTKVLGIIYCFEMYNKTNNYIEFNALTIHPIYDCAYFKKHLLKL